LNQLIAQRAAGAQRAAAAGMVRVNYPRSNNTSENTQSRKRVSAENARTRSNSLRNRIALLNTLSALSNANLLARMQGPNKNNIEKTLLENNASLLQRIKRLQGLNNKAQDLEVLIKLRSYNNNKLFKDLFKWTTPQRQYITRILPLLNMPLWQKILSFDQAISRAQAQARAQPTSQQRLELGPIAAGDPNLAIRLLRPHLLGSEGDGTSHSQQDPRSDRRFCLFWPKPSSHRPRPIGHCIGRAIRNSGLRQLGGALRQRPQLQGGPSHQTATDKLTARIHPGQAQGRACIGHQHR
jgi:hypothetical protein